MDKLVKLHKHLFALLYHPINIDFCSQVSGARSLACSSSFDLLVVFHM